MLLVPHRVPGEGVPATVIVRANRFLARCRLDDGREVEAHVPDRGRCVGILEPGARARLYPTPPSETRRTAFSLLVCEEKETGVLVAIDPAGANRRVRALLDAGLVPGLPKIAAIRPEWTFQASRIDFHLTTADGPVALEVKSAGAAKDGVALFPDAPTERGARHLEELADYARSGAGKAMVLFVAQRGDAKAVRAWEEIDPAFARTMRRLAKWISYRAVAFDVRPGACAFLGEVPVVGV